MNRASVLVAFAAAGTTALLGGCTRADEYVVFVNDCDVEIAVEGDAIEGPLVVAPGDASMESFRNEPALTIEIDLDRAPATVGVDTAAWRTQLGLGMDGVVVVEGPVCEGVGPVLLVAMAADESEALFSHRLQRGRE